MDWRRYIERNPKVILGKPVIRGTRLTVELLVGRLAAGATKDDLLESYPKLKRLHIRAALAHAAALPSDEVLDVQGAKA